MIIFGGAFKWSTVVLSNEVWALWLPPSGPPAWQNLSPLGDSPSARTGHSAIYDAANQRMIVFGGNDGTNDLGDLWSLSLTPGQTAWSALMPSSPPPPRAFHSAIYDGANQQMVVYGGTAGATDVRGDLWTLSLPPSGTPSWRQLPAMGNAPSSRRSHAAIYDEQGLRMIIAAGLDAQGQGLSDVWSLSLGATPGWTSLPGKGALGESFALYDRLNQRMVVTSGPAGTVYSLPLAPSSPGTWEARGVFGDGLAVVYDPWNQRMIGFDNGVVAEFPLGDAPAPAFSSVLVPSLGREGSNSYVDDGVGKRMFVLTQGLGVGPAPAPAAVDVWTLSYASKTGLGLPTWERIDASGTSPMNPLATIVVTPGRLLVVDTANCGSSCPAVFDFSLDTGAWRSLNPTGGGPSQRGFASGAYDSANGRLILFGGFAPDMTIYNDLWELALPMSGDPAWKQLTPSGDFPPRFFPSVSYDPAKQRMIVFGGTGLLTPECDGGRCNPVPDPKNDTWELSLEQDGGPAWKEIQTSPTRPGGRYFHVAAFDSDNERLIVHGGGNGTNMGSGNNTPLIDAWALSLGGPAPHLWTELPDSRFDSPVAAAYDNIQQRMIVARARTVSSLWVPAATPMWSQLSVAGGAPDPRAGHTTIYDSVHQEMILFGGTNQTGRFNDLWSIPLETGDTRGWMSLSPTGAPPPKRESHTAIYDAANERLVVFGGRDWNTYYNDVWTFSLAAGSPPAWQLLSPGNAPGKRAEHTAVYDSANQRMIVFGGYDGTQYFNDVWSLSLAPGAEGWAPLAPTGMAPAKRKGHGAIYDDTDSRMIVISGTGEQAPPLLTDVWALSLPSNGSPAWESSSIAAGSLDSRAAVYDRTNRRVIVPGSQVGVLSLGDELSWQSYDPLLARETPGLSAVYDTANQRTIVFGGMLADSYQNDTWSLAWRVCTGDQGTPRARPSRPLVRDFTMK
jgi:hypothetical protein